MVCPFSEGHRALTVSWLWNRGNLESGPCPPGRDHTHSELSTPEERKGTVC